MTNREVRKINTKLRDINAFHFVCPKDREREAREVLSSIDGIIVFPETKPVDHWIFGTNKRLVGNMIGGICYPWMTGIVLAELSGRNIADAEIRILKQRELKDAYGTVTGYRKWLRRI